MGSRDRDRGARSGTERERERERTGDLGFEGDLESFGLVGRSFSTDGDLEAL